VPNRGEQIKEEILSHLAARNQKWLALVRDEAARIAASLGCVTADDVREYGDSLPIQPSHKYARGAIFRDPRFVCVGERVSTSDAHHGKTIKLWNLAVTEVRHA